ncbi:hypothetical protein [Polyangium aurulentum]|uniref:hypothetical protein n=1 Tax=Polyangium aurulentum TaxID=2567896 RepID=UPI0010AEDB5A|nr:hypothetical protein [Polyangium aurulentum]UQA63090.1 hypothetical protein E8A73_022560 [Polyangium aurulentum]
MRSLIPAAGLFLLASAAAPAFAEPTLPVGWTAPKVDARPVTSAPAPECCGFAWMRMISRSPRAARAPAPFDVEALPVTSPIAPIPKTVPDDARAAAELFIADGRGKTRSSWTTDGGIDVRVSVRDRRAGRITLGAMRWHGFGAQSEGGAKLRCGEGERFSTLRFQSLRPGPGKTLHFEETRGLFDRQACRGWVTSELHVDAVPLREGLVYAYRTHCADCGEGERDVLHVITPDFQLQATPKGVASGFDDKSLPFNTHEVPFGPGLAGAFAGVTGDFTYGAAFLRWRTTGAVPPTDSDVFFIGVDVSQAVSEPHPTALLTVF